MPQVSPQPFMIYSHAESLKTWFGRVVEIVCSVVTIVTVSVASAAV